MSEDVPQKKHLDSPLAVAKKKTRISNSPKVDAKNVAGNTSTNNQTSFTAKHDQSKSSKQILWTGEEKTTGKSVL